MKPTAAVQPVLCKTGVPGLDDILCGGLPAYRIYLLQGDPGVGKTTLGLQFLQEGVRYGEKGLYITLSETREELEQVAASHGWDLEGIDIFELSSLQAELQGKADSTFFHPSEVELNRTVAALLERVDHTNPVRVMMFEHDNAGDILRKIRSLSRDFAAPADACPSYKGLYAGLEDFERDLHRHIHLENNVLFPQAIELESASISVPA